MSMKGLYLRKVVLVLLCSLLLSGCGLFGADKSADVKTEKSDVQAGKKIDLKTATDKAENSDEEQGEEVYDVEGLYMQFLEGKRKVTVPNGEMLQAGEYNLEELTAAYGRALGEEMLSNTPAGIEYGIIDCGMDARPELALRMEFSDGQGGGFTTGYVLLKATDGGLEYLTDEQSYGHLETEINSAGVIRTTVIYGYESAFQSEKFIDADGKTVFVYSCNSSFGMESNIIPEDYLPKAVREKVKIEYEGGDQNDYGYSMMVYNFTELSADYTEEEYEEYLRENRFAFYDKNDMSAMPEDEITDLYRKNDILLYEVEELEGILEENRWQLGLTDELMNAPAISWQPWKTQKP